MHLDWQQRWNDAIIIVTAASQSATLLSVTEIIASIGASRDALFNALREPDYGCDNYTTHLCTFSQLSYRNGIKVPRILMVLGLGWNKI